MRRIASAVEHAKTGRLPVEAPGAGASADEIARRAYEIYLARGDENGDPLQDWLQAEKELAEQEPAAKS